jgi:hypothetical protein
VAITHLTAEDDQAKVHRTKLFNPVRVAKVFYGLIVEWFTGLYLSTGVLEFSSSLS